MFTSITIENLRGINQLSINDFKKFNLFVGKNNCGKTTVLEALFLLINPSNAELILRINNFRGLDLLDERLWSLLFNKLNIETPVKLFGKLNNLQNRQLIIKPHRKSNETFVIPSSETKIIDLSKLDSAPYKEIDGLYLEFYPQMNNKKENKPIELQIMRKEDKIEWTSPKDYSEIYSGSFLNYVTLYTQLGEKFSNVEIKKQTEIILEILKEIDTNILDLKLGRKDTIYCDIGLNELVPISVMGDGTLRTLSIILTIFNTKDGVVLIDEIDNGLHYTTQKIIWEGIFKAARQFNVQIFATTHSFECVNAFNSVYSEIRSDLFENKDNLRLFRLDKDKEEINAVVYNHEQLSTSIESGWEFR